MTRNQRATSRHTVTLAAQLTVQGESRSEQIHNLGLGGARLSCQERLGIGTRVELSFRIPTQAEAIVIGACVRWCSKGEMGLQFDGLRAKEVWALNQYLSATTAV